MGNSCGKQLRETVAGNSCGKQLLKIMERIITIILTCLADGDRRYSLYQFLRNVGEEGGGTMQLTP